MTFASKSLLLAAVFAAVLSGVLWHRLDSTRHDNQTLRRELQTEQQARNTAEWLLHGQEQTMQVFSAIRAANRAARLADETEHHDAKQKLQPPLPVTIAALVLCLPLLLTGCGNSKNAPVPSVVILPETDAELTEATPVPPMPQPLTWGASLLWNADLLMALGQCNRDKASVREQETRRKEIYERRPEPGGGAAAR